LLGRPELVAVHTSEVLGDGSVAHRRIGEGYRRILSEPLFRLLMRWYGVADLTKIVSVELERVWICTRENGGRRSSRSCVNTASLLFRRRPVDQQCNGCDHERGGDGGSNNRACAIDRQSGWP
jgi:hypothetical protein